MAHTLETADTQDMEDTEDTEDIMNLADIKFQFTNRVVSYQLDQILEYQQHQALILKLLVGFNFSPKLLFLYYDLYL